MVQEYQEIYGQAGRILLSYFLLEKRVVYEFQNG